MRGSPAISKAVVVAGKECCSIRANEIWIAIKKSKENGGAEEAKEKGVTFRGGSR